ncbi:MAG: helix-turn-helix domain-containing protein [Acutalibacteraceae bacterium]|jgi:AraC-like DNA-binding protein
MKYLDYPEQQKYGNIGYPYFFYHVDKTHPRYNMPFHWHPLFEVLHVFQGHFLLQLNEQTLLLNPGDTAFIQGGITHGGAPQKSADCCYECLLMDLDKIFLSSSSIRLYEPKLTDIFTHRVVLNHFYSAEMIDINGRVLQLLRLFHNPGEMNILSLIGNTFLLFSCIINNKYYTETPTNQDTKKYAALKKALTFIETHYQEHLDLPTLAACVNLNPSYFCRYFKEMTHRTPIDYLNYYRIEVACEQMIYSHRSITEIAYDCGFADSSYFIKVFHHYKHMTPTQYIKGAKRSDDMHSEE